MTIKNVVRKDAKDDLFPVFKSDIMEQEESRAVPPVTPYKEIQPIHPSYSSLDAIELWRYMSEKYRDQRLSRGAIDYQSKQLQQKKKETKSFQKDYEKDNLNISSNAYQDKSLLSNLLQKIRMANLDVDPNLIVKPDKNDYKLPDDGVLRVANVMSKDVVCVIDSMTIEQVASLFNKNKITGVPVVHYLTKNLLGVISTTDILNHIFEGKVISTYNTDGTFFRQDTLAVLDKKVSDFMATNVIEVGPDCPVKDACRMMIDRNVHRVIITENDKVKGVFSTSDATRLLANFDLKLSNT